MDPGWFTSNTTASPKGKKERKQRGGGRCSENKGEAKNEGEGERSFPSFFFFLSHSILGPFRPLLHPRGSFGGCTNKRKRASEIGRRVETIGSIVYEDK
jgi:hypothetical protein